ncbi:MAG: hypothetical protein AB2806_17355 [Candidatus Thiodiazotropha sp.]
MTIKHSLVITILYVLITGFHVAASWNQSAPHVVPDEVSYLKQAQYFSGKYTFQNTKPSTSKASSTANNGTTPSIFEVPYYHFGYSLLVSPIYWLTDTPSAAHKGVMVFNSFMLSSLFLIIFFWIRIITKDINFRTAIAIALIVSLYPPYIIQAHIGWAENAFIPGFALSCLLFTRHLKAGSITTMILFALIAGFQYTIHPRGIAVSVAAIICIAGLSLVRKDKWQLSITGIILVLGIIIATKMKTAEMAIMMNAVSHSGRILKNLSSIFESELITVVIGNLLYLILASLGIFLLGITESVKQLIDKGSNNLKCLVSDIYTGSLIYTFIASFLTFCTSILFLAREEEWHSANGLLDIFLYGRYNEAFLSIYIALGLIWICRTYKQGIQQYSKRLNVAFWLVATVSIASTLLLSDFPYLRSIHTYGIYSWYVLSMIVDKWFGNTPVILGPLIWTWLVLQLLLQSKSKGLLAVGTYFFLLDLFLISYIIPNFKIFGV